MATLTGTNIAEPLSLDETAEPGKLGVFGLQPTGKLGFFDAEALADGEYDHTLLTTEAGEPFNAHLNDIKSIAREWLDHTDIEAAAVFVFDSAAECHKLYDELVGYIDGKTADGVNGDDMLVRGCEINGTGTLVLANVHPNATLRELLEELDLVD